MTTPTQASPSIPMSVRLIGLTAATILLQFVSMFLPWFQIGERKRSSFEVLDAAVTFSPKFNTLTATIEVAWIMLPAFGAMFALLWVADFRKLGLVGSRIVITAYTLFGLFSIYFAALKLGSGLCVVSGIGYIVGVVVLQRKN